MDVWRKASGFWGSHFAGPFHFLAFLIKTKIDKKENNNWGAFRKLRLRKQGPKTLKTKTLKSEKTETGLQ